MNSEKKFAFAAAVMMLAVAAIAAVNVSEDSDATAAGTFTVYFSTNGGTSWSNQTVQANNASDAIMASQWKASGDSCVVFDETPSGSYASLNTDYGDIIKFYGQQNHLENDVWNVFVFVNGAWTTANSGLGFYKCFDDYNASWRTANVALYYGSEATSVPSTLSASMSNMSSITSVSNQSAFLTTFHIRVVYPGAMPTVNGTVKDINGTDVTAAKLRTGATIRGYGSDAFLALINAVNNATQTNVTGYDGVPQTGYYWYGWLTGLFGLDTVKTYEGDPSTWEDDLYSYWMIYESYSGSSSVTSHYNLGFLGATGAGSIDTDVTIVYAQGGM